MSEVLGCRAYPGRGCLAARTGDGTLCFVYFLTGRSPASRNREVVVLADGDVAVRETAGTGRHDRLRYYVAAARRHGCIVVGNGDHVPPLADALVRCVPVLAAWEQHTFEPDPPIFTPRIWMARLAGTAADCLIGYVGRSCRGDDDADRAVWAVSTVMSGTGVFITTYDGTVTNVEVADAPEDVRVTATTPRQLLDEIWSALDPSLRVAAVALNVDDTTTPPLLVH